MNVPDEFKVRIALPIPELIGGSQKIRGGPWLCSRCLFPLENPMPTMQTIHVCHCMSLCNRFPAIFDWSFGRGLRISNLGKGGRRGSGMDGWYRSKERW